MPDYLTRLFRRELGTTPMRYVWAERVRLGVDLLEHTGLPVSEVAARTGFQSANHFARLVGGDGALAAERAAAAAARGSSRPGRRPRLTP